MAVDPSSCSLTPGYSVTPIRPPDYLSTPWMVQLTPGVDMGHFENHWFRNFQGKSYDEQPLKRECFREINLWMTGTKRTDFSEDLCIGIVYGIVILGIKNICKASMIYSKF